MLFSILRADSSSDCRDFCSALLSDRAFLSSVGPWLCSPRGSQGLLQFCCQPGGPNPSRKTKSDFLHQRGRPGESLLPGRGAHIPSVGAWSQQGLLGWLLGHRKKSGDPQPRGKQAVAVQFKTRPGFKQGRAAPLPQILPGANIDSSSVVAQMK